MTRHNTTTGTTTSGERIRRYLDEAFPGLADAPGGGQGLDEHADLLDLLDSLQLLRLVVDLEQLFAIKVENRDMTPENLGSIAKLAAYVDSRRKQGGG